MMSVKLFRTALLLCTALLSAFCTFYVLLMYCYLLRFGAQTQYHHAITLRSGKYLIQVNICRKKCFFTVTDYTPLKK
ncbi:hypothetical protein DES37_102199 [Mangrovibacter plantisponsor]|uniref:Uncharacterized protein n=1 Tax=Mangrovibacter plantisponsor TaxID=451513 RepID=A0A317Q7W2_9ENTR|nr:hypothetical protein DES37_102199 [Mangrovibacter plantisponsor]